MEKDKLNRINELAHKSKAEGLTDEEKIEQAALRSEFLAEIRADLRASLDSIEIIEDAPSE
jgi:5-formyltetrahydrofolate cyclo-ligase